MSKTTQALRHFHAALQANHDLFHSFLDRVYIEAWPELEELRKSDLTAFRAEGSRRWQSVRQRRLPKTADDLMWLARAVGFSPKGLTAEILVEKVAPKLAKALPTKLSVPPSRPRKKVSLKLLALLCGVDNLPQEVEIEAFGEMVRRHPELAERFAAAGVDIPTSRAEWFNLLGRAGIPAELLATGRIRPRDLLAYVQGKQAALAAQEEQKPIPSAGSDHPAGRKPVSTTHAEHRLYSQWTTRRANQPALTYGEFAKEHGLDEEEVKRIIHRVGKRRRRAKKRS